MRNTIFILGVVSALTLFSCNKDKASDLFTDAEKTEQSENIFDPAMAPVISFNEQNHDFGELPTGAKVEHYFTFTNTGKSPLVIKNAVPSCGCTVPAWPKEPIAPGATDSIKVSFDGNGKYGRQQNTVTLTANTVNRKDVLTFRATLPPRAEQPAGVQQLK